MEIIFKKYVRQSICLLVVVVLVIMGCQWRRAVNVDQKKASHSTEVPTIAVFVHGTRLFPKFALQEQHFSASGMVKISDLDQSYKTMHMIANDLSCLAPKRFCYDLFYAFGWEGELNFDARRETAKVLYDVLNQLVDDYEKKNGVRPHLLLIAHSHGCNVVLSLAAVKVPNNRLTTDIILLACPVQDETKELIADPMFGKRYALCSQGDMVQIIDPQGLQRNHCKQIFSGRWFDRYPGVMQATIKISGRAILHIEFILERFMKRLPEILDILDGWYDKAKLTDGIQPLPFPTIDLRSSSLRVHTGNRRRRSKTA